MYMMMNRKEAGTEVDRESGELNLKKKKNKKKISIVLPVPTFVLTDQLPMELMKSRF